MRIVSLLPSATEILFALGLDREIVGVSHECDFPPRARTKPVVIHSRMPQSADRPRVAFLEWLQPFYTGGHWVPEMIQVAGGVDALGKVRTPSFRVHLQNIVEAEPEILLIAPCGYSAQQARDEYRSMDLPEQWQAMPAVRNGRVYALEANSYFSRPGPRLITGIEAIAKLLHPAIAGIREAEFAT